MQARQVIGRPIQLVVLGFAILGVPEIALGQTTIRGRILYGPLLNDANESVPPDTSACGSAVPTLPGGFIRCGDPIAHVWVQLRDGSGVRRDQTITDAQGNFRMEVNGTPNLTLVTKAKNDYVQVKRFNGWLDNWPTDDVLSTEREIVVDYSRAENNLGDIEVTHDSYDDWYLNDDPTNRKNFVSRAFYVTTAAHISGSRVETELGTAVPRNLLVRIGTPDSTFYLTLDTTIFLGSEESSAFWHEYGHFLEDKLAAFDLLPAYSADGGHGACDMMTASTLSEVCYVLPGLPALAGLFGFPFGWIPCNFFPNDNSPNLPWPWLEGFAEFIGAANARWHYGSSTDAMTAAMSPEYDLEDTACGLASDYSEPRAVEAIVSETLWDLFDDQVDSANTTGIVEFADRDLWEILQVFNDDVYGIDQFWDAWRVRHDGIVPDLYAAYAFNGIAIGNAADLTAPEPPTVWSDTHPIASWSNQSYVQLNVRDGQDDTPYDHDDVSGSYWYYVTVDTQHDTTPSVSGASTFASEDVDYEYALRLFDGANQYVHVNTTDMAYHASGASHYGPIHIDTVDPYAVNPLKAIPFRIDPAVVSSDPTLVLGYPCEIRWDYRDDLSQVEEVEISFVDPQSGFSRILHSTGNQTGSLRWLVEDVPVTASGEIVVNIRDFAGNEISESVPAPVIPPFSGPIIPNLAPDSDPCEDARVVSGDLHGDGFDDVVLVCRWNQTGHLYVFRGSNNGLAVSQHFAWRPADDLTLGDLDYDGDLDLVTVSYAAPGVATQLEILTNDGTGTLVNALIVKPLGALWFKTVRMVNPTGDRKPVLVVFGTVMGNQPAIVAFDINSGFIPTLLPGLDPVAGDWEAAEVTGDGNTDLIALGFDANGQNALSMFTLGAAGWTRSDVASFVSVSKADVDVGDFDADGKPDLFLMFENAGVSRITRLLRRTAAAGFLFSSAASATDVTRRVAQGDGYIIDTANDARGEVIAMGLDSQSDISGWYLRNDAIVGGFAEATLIEAQDLLYQTDTAWGDFDDDGDLDVFQVGRDATDFRIVRSDNNLGNYIDQNDAPNAPANLSAVYDSVRGGYVFTWSAPLVANDETPSAGYGYELRVGTTPNGVELVSWAHPAGASQQGHSLSRFVRMPRGSYWYDVRTVDSGWQRSAPAGARPTPP